MARLWVKKRRWSHLLSFLGRGDLQPQLDNALQDVNDLYLLLEETEKQAVRKALVEERGRFCTFIAFLQPVVVRALFPWSSAALLGIPHPWTVEVEEEVAFLDWPLVHLRVASKVMQTKRPSRMFIENSN